MRDKTHDDHILRWAEFMRQNPETWKAIHSEFINAQFQHSEEFYKRVAKTKGGKEKIIKIFKIKNINGYPSLKK